MNKYKTNRGRVAFVALSFGIIAMLMIVSANNRAVELTYESPYEESKEVVLDDRAEAYIAEAIEAIDVIIEEAENAEEDLEPETFNEAFAEARALLGTGHAFTWKGQEYTTSYAEELAANSSPVKEKTPIIATIFEGIFNIITGTMKIIFYIVIIYILFLILFK